uniref:Uncharacterized protein n=1 Tax=Eutreptiella gymnastica TaxID=73025 RepID=A0A7S1IP42_9EUGL|mmetsp:Transcript_32686/g.58622  ORF Transcript_32686/g.58622 Transcript_32686/m.58622 type:complete len:290 (+) Transcript_32686:77-946(+)
MTASTGVGDPHFQLGPPVKWAIPHSSLLNTPTRKAVEAACRSLDSGHVSRTALIPHPPPSGRLTPHPEPPSNGSAAQPSRPPGRDSATAAVTAERNQWLAPPVRLPSPGLVPFTPEYLQDLEQERCTHSNLLTTWASGMAIADLIVVPGIPPPASGPVQSSPAPRVRGHGRRDSSFHLPPVQGGTPCLGQVIHASTHGSKHPCRSLASPWAQLTPPTRRPRPPGAPRPLQQRSLSLGPKGSLRADGSKTSAPYRVRLQRYMSGGLQRRFEASLTGREDIVGLGQHFTSK